MNYIAEIKAFYDRLELNPQPSPAIALWHALMSIANKAGWPDMFTVASSVLGLRAGLNAQAVKRARNQLAQSGLITWQSRGGNLSAVYHMNTLVVQNDMKNVPQIEPQNEPQCEPQNEPQVVPQIEPINKHKHKPKQKKDSKESKESQLRADALFETLWKEYPEKKGKGQVSMQSKLTLLDIGEDHMMRCIERYKSELKKDSDWRRAQNGSTFFNSGYIDYLDENYEPSAPKSLPKRANCFSGYENQREYDADELMMRINGG